MITKGPFALKTTPQLPNQSTSNNILHVTDNHSDLPCSWCVVVLCNFNVWSNRSNTKYYGFILWQPSLLSQIRLNDYDPDWRQAQSLCLWGAQGPVVQFNRFQSKSPSLSPYIQTMLSSNFILSNK